MFLHPIARTPLSVSQVVPSSSASYILQPPVLKSGSAASHLHEAFVRQVDAFFSAYFTRDKVWKA